jgi:hypothetical protein
MRFIKSEKAVSEVIGYIIILGLTITGIALVILVGVPSIIKLQDMSTVKNAEQAYTVLDSRVSQVALGVTPEQVIDFELQDGSLSVKPNSSSDPSYILFQFTSGTGTANITIPMGKIVYRKGDRDVAYEGGGVWSKYPTGSVMLSPPEFNYNGVTITMPIMNITGNISTGGKGKVPLKFEKKGNVTLLYPSGIYTNPISTNVSEIIITVKSEYYEAWADYFESLTLTKVSSYPGEEKVIVRLDPPPIITNFNYGALASKKIELTNTAAIDAYNSSIGPYLISKTNNGGIRANDEIKLSNNAEIRGIAETSGSITEGNCNGGKCRILIDAYYNSIGSNIKVNGSTCPNVHCFLQPLQRAKPADTTGLVEGKISSYASANDNGGAAPCITANALGTTPSPCTIHNGNYYVTSFNLPNNYNLIFDTNAGGINIAVPADIVISKATITVNGTHPVKIYLRGGMSVGTNSVVNYNTNQTSSRFQVISDRSSPVSFSQGNTIFVGIVFAPFATISVSQGAQIFGAMVGDTFSVTQSQDIHFDEDLKNLETDLGSGTTMTYAYITRNDLVVS